MMNMKEIRRKIQSSPAKDALNKEFFEILEKGRKRGLSWAQIHKAFEEEGVQTTVGALQARYYRVKRG